jgi:hypothetical protein
MAVKTFLELGRAIDNALLRIWRLVRSRIEKGRISPGVIIDFAADAYLIGADVGWQVHASYLGYPAYLSKSDYERFRMMALNHGQFVAARYMDIAAKRGGLTRAETTFWSKIAGEASLWRGQDESSRIIANQAEAEFKTWIRAYAREDEREHSSLEGVMIPVDTYFTLPNGVKVWGPRDWSSFPSPAEWVNCGHALVYSRTAKRSDTQKTMVELFRPRRVSV